MKNNRWLGILLAVFIFSRFFGLGQYYHQDEYRWASQVYTAEFSEVDSPHPPIMQNLLSLNGKILGYDNLRVVPFIFGILNLLLIYLLSLMLTANRKIAYLAVGLYTVNVYSLIANLQIDIDGSVLPFFVLSTYYFYLNAVKEGEKNFILPLAAVIIAGLLTKLSFVIFFGALAVEYLWILYNKGRLRYEVKRIGLILVVSGIFIAGFYLLYGKADPRFAEYSTNFKMFNFASRAYFDLFLRMFKFFIWLSPLLFIPMAYGLFKKDIFIKYKVWYIYTLFNFLFYLVIFDFARLPIERYFMFIIVPAVLISADVIYSLFSGLNKKYLILSVVGLAVLLIFTVLAVHDIVPLNPKEAYIEKIKDLDFNFLIPLTGGSGPIGFYGSAQFILWAWIACVVGFFMNKKRQGVVLFLIFGVGYNVLFSIENLTGVVYGSVDKITKSSVEYVINNPEIDEVVTYYDAGVYYLKIADKYLARFYTAPSRDYTPRISSYRGYYMIVDFPAIDKDGRYWPLINRCSLLKKFQDKQVESYVFDCSGVPF